MLSAIPTFIKYNQHSKKGICMPRTIYLLTFLTTGSMAVAETPHKKKEETKETSQAKNQQSEKTETHCPQPSKHQNTSPQTQTVTVKNNIKPDMLAYKHWTGTYEPSIFTVSINGQTIEQDKEYKVLASDNTLEVRYDYSFANGFKKEAKIVKFQIETNSNDLNLTFSWNDEWHVIMDHTTPLEAKKVPFKPNKV